MRLTNAKLMEGYGLSEAITAVTFNPVKAEQRIGCVGIPISDTEVLIVDLEKGTEIMPSGECGEVIFRGPQRIREYWRNPEETAAAVREGWFYTGDIGYLDENGFLYIVDRKKDMINVGGFNVYPSEIDGILFTHPQIYESCTIGVAHSRLGEVAMSFVVPLAGAKLQEAEIISYCREQLTDYKVPKQIRFLKEIPKTSVNKPDKKTLRQIAKDSATNDYR
jgi:long-chain acyl-CoA synthetase